MGCSLHHCKLLAQKFFVELEDILPSGLLILNGNIYCTEPPVPLDHSAAVRFAVFAQKVPSNVHAERPTITTSLPL